MPPRKRAAAPPKSETPGEETTPKEPGTAPATGDEAAPQPPAGTEDTGGGDGTAPPSETPPETPAKSDLQDVEQPCAECFPGGWPEQAFSVGCAHGTWIRESKS